MKIQLFLLLFAGSLLAACSEHFAEKSTTVTDADTIQEQQQQHHEDEDGIQLNDGKKWVVEPKMLVYIRTIESALHNFKGTTMDDYNQLAELIDNELGLLTGKCTMSGKAHDELHKWLLPFIDSSNSFFDEEELSQKKEKLSALKTSFETFNTYFE
ncbi:MAG: hypothetical protein ACK40M_12265 [Flavobacteriales bacterium]